MKILVLDTLGKDTYKTFFTQQVLEKLEKLGTVDYLPYQRTEEGYEQLKERIHGIDVVFCSWGVPLLREDFYQAADSLKVIAYTGGSVGDLANEPLQARPHITLLSGNPFFAESVAQGTICYMLMGQRRLYQDLKETERTGWWRHSYNDGLRGKTVGLVSFGMIAKHVARMLQVFDCKVKVYSSHGLTDAEIKQYHIEEATLEELFSTCDVVSIHSGMTPKTYHMVDAKLLGLMKDGALLINTARGAVIDEAALEEEVISGRIRAVLDVFEVEPLPAESRLRGLDNVVIVPHCGGPTVDVRELLTLNMIDDVASCMAGNTDVPSRIPMEYAKNMTSHTAVSKRKEKVSNS